MATGVTNERPTKTVLGFATLFGEDGRAMHKSWGNAIEFNEGADKIGADVMRWMFANQRYDTDMLFGYHHADETRRRFFIPLWNVYSFFVTYANLDGWTPNGIGELSPLDRWIHARLHELIGEANAALSDYDMPRFAKAAEVFVDDLSNWYVRRSRRRFWKSDGDADKQAAYSTLYEVLVNLAKVLAPVLPFLAEALYQNLVRSVDANAPESVHHCAYPRAVEFMIDRTLLNDVALSRAVVTLGHSIRSSANLKVRQPLGKAIVVVAHDQRRRVERTADIIADELNVKLVELAEDEAALVTYKLLPDNKKLGPKFGAKFPQVRSALQSAPAFAVAHAVRSGQRVTVGEFELAPDEILITPQPREGFAIASEGGVVVALDTHVTPELKQEGQAREVVRRVQDLRKTAGFEISDHIVLTYQAEGEMQATIEQWAAYIKSETLADELRAGEPVGTSDEDEIDGMQVKLGVEKK
jgi:isoleucyl-tRNA synthetase